MTTYDRDQLRPPYPVYSEAGMSAKPQPFGPPDLRPSGFGPGYSVYSSAHGRNLAGTNDMKHGFDSKNAEGIETYPNELDALSVADDVVGNGVFDPNDTHGNIHPEDGVFQDHQNLPGYVARDQFYELSEVRDLTNPGGRVMYVPGGAVSYQQGQTQTYADNDLLWKLPPGMSPLPQPNVPNTSIVDAPTATWPVGQAESEGGSNYTPYFVAAGIGVALGLAWIAWKR